MKRPYFQLRTGDKGVCFLGCYWLMVLLTVSLPASYLNKLLSCQL